MLRVMSALTVASLLAVGIFAQAVGGQPSPPAGAASAQGGVTGGVFGPIGPVVVAIGEQHGVNPGPWWIGVQCRPADPALRAQLGLAENVGLIVDEVVPNSPADKAGLKRFDVLVKAEDKELRSVQDLIDVINRAEGKEIKLKYIRQAQEAELALTPEKRPQPSGPIVTLPPIPQFEWPEFEWFGGPGGPFRFRFFYPGRILPPRAGQLPPLPGNLAVTITKKGDEPAKISVKRDGESWEVTENELDKLPADIRPHVEQVLRGGPVVAPPSEEEGPKDRPKRGQWEFYWPVPPGWNPAEEQRLRQRIEQELKELQRRMEELRERIDELRKRPPVRQQPPRDPAKPQGQET